jgi:hypothetical protein
MGIKEVEVTLGGMAHTVQINDADKNFEVRKDAPKSESTEKAKEPANKSRAPQNKAAKPAAKKPAAKTAVEAASDPDASE